MFSKDPLIKILCLKAKLEKNLNAEKNAPCSFSLLKHQLKTDLLKKKNVCAITPTMPSLWTEVKWRDLFES